MSNLNNKLSPDYRPLSNEEMKMLVGKRLIHKKCGYIHLVISLYTYWTMWMVVVGKKKYSSVMLLETFVYEDGTPVGVKTNIEGTDNV